MLYQIQTENMSFPRHSPAFISSLFFHVPKSFTASHLSPLHWAHSLIGSAHLKNYSRVHFRQRNSLCTMSSSTTEQNQNPPYTISSFPLVGTIVRIKDPTIIQTISEHPSSRRIESYTPFLLNIVLYATQFATPTENGSKLPGGQFCLAFTNTDTNQQQRRRLRTENNLETLLTPERVEKVKQLVKSDIDSQKLADEVIKILGPSVIGYDGQFPPAILEAMADMASMVSSFNPITYLKARKGRKIVEDWVRVQFPEEPYYIDIVHDVVTMYTGLTAGLMSLRQVQPGEDIYTHTGKNAILPATFRVAAQETDFDGNLDRKIPRGSMIVFDLVSAAASAKDIAFVFGTGSQVRQCPFKNLFMDIGAKILDN